MTSCSPPSEQRYIWLPVLIKYRKIWHPFFLSGKVLIHCSLDGTRWYGWLFCAGPIMVTAGRQARASRFVKKKKRRRG